MYRKRGKIGRGGGEILVSWRSGFLLKGFIVGEKINGSDIGCCVMKF